MFGFSTKRVIALSGFAATTFFLFIPSFAYAYIDPATTSYIIQLAIGLVISLSVAFGVFFRRAQLAFVTARARISALWVVLASRAQQSDTAAAKDTEEKRTEVAPPKRRVGGAIDRKAWDDERKRNRPKEPFNLKRWLFEEKRPFKQRLIIALLLAGSLAVTYLICNPLDLFIANRQYIPYQITSILPYLIGIGSIGFIVLLCFLLIFKGRMFDIIGSLFLGCLVMLYVQGSFLNMDLGLLTGDTIDWSRYAGWAVIDTLICAAIVLIPLGIYALSKKVWRSAVLFVPGLMIAVQVISLLTVAASSEALFVETDNDNPEMVLTDSGLNEVSPSENIIVLVLDRTDGSFMDQIKSEDPGFFENRFEGFTCFTNYNSYYNMTFPSVCNLLTGARYDFNTPANTFMDQAYADSDFFADMKSAGWTNYVYTSKDYCYNNAAPLQNAVANVDDGQPIVDGFVAVKKLYKLTLFSYSPQIIKPRFWTVTDEFYEGVDYGTMYKINDHAYYANLLETGLAFGTNQNEKRFSFIHLNGSHAPYTFGLNMEEIPAEQGNEIMQTRAAYTIAFEYLDQLKEMGLYEDATIIVTADHGSKNTPEQLPNSACLFVKPSKSAQTPMAFNSAPVTFESFRATIMQAAGGGYEKYGPTYFEVPENAEVTRTLNYRYIPSGKTNTWCYEYEIKGDMNDIKSWELMREYEFGFEVW